MRAGLVGLDQVLRFVSHYKFSSEDVDYIRQHPSFAHCEEGFYDWLLNLDMSKVKMRAMKEGSLCFPQEPLISVEGKPTHRRWPVTDLSPPRPQLRESK